MDLISAFLVSVADLLKLAIFSAALAVIVFFAMFVVELAESLLNSWFQGLTGVDLTRKRCAEKALKNN